MTDRLFLITGVSTGLGRAVAERVLDAGNRVVGTLRRPEQIAEFEALAPGRAFGRLLDVTDEEAIPGVIAEIESSVGPIDVLLNNAGYGVEGTVEESSMRDLRAQLDVNVFGVVAVTKAVLPGMRERRSGHILFITSMGGLRAFPGLAFYHTSKYAVEGFADSLRMEVAGFGVKVTAVEPGGFRTDWAGRSMHRVERSVADYDELFAPIRAGRQGMSGNQLGNPAKAGDAILAVVDAAEPPAHLMLGSDALRLVTEARRAFDAEAETWHGLTVSTDFPDGRTL